MFGQKKYAPEFLISGQDIYMLIFSAFVSLWAGCYIMPFFLNTFSMAWSERSTCSLVWVAISE